MVTAVVAAGATGLAGCGGLTGEASSNGGGRTCESGAKARDELSDLKQQASASPGETVTLRVVPNRDSDDFGAFKSQSLLSGDRGGVPGSARRGDRPGRVAPPRVRATARRVPAERPHRGRREPAEGETHDPLTVAFTCQRAPPVPGE
jgi:hypothetical protein